MKKHYRGLMAAMLALSGYAAIPAYADVLNIPASAAIYSDTAGNACASVIDAGYGVAGIAGCDFEIPLTIPVGRTIQQISVVHHDIIGPIPNPAYSASLTAIDFSTSVVSSGQFPWSWTGFANTAYQVTRLMAQTKFGAYPDAFLVQPNTMYEVVLHVQGSAIASGLQVTYQ
jgi:hypothetical protein